MEDRNHQDYEKGYRKGIEAALHMFESQLECSDFIRESLSRMAGHCPSPRQPPLEMTESPRFLGAHQFVRNFKLGDRKRIIGRADGKEVVIALVGHVDTHIVAEDDDGGFTGRCEMLLPGEAVPSMTGYCLGSIDGTGTALIVGQDDKLYVYSPEDALNLPWEKLNTEGAELVVNAQNITLRSIPGMMAKSIEEG